MGVIRQDDQKADHIFDDVIKEVLLLGDRHVLRKLGEQLDLLLEDAFRLGLQVVDQRHLSAVLVQDEFCQFVIDGGDCDVAKGGAGL